MEESLDKIGHFWENWVFDHDTMVPVQNSSLEEIGPGVPPWSKQTRDAQWFPTPPKLCKNRKRSTLRPIGSRCQMTALSHVTAMDGQRCLKNNIWHDWYSVNVMSDLGVEGFEGRAVVARCWVQRKLQTERKLTKLQGVVCLGEYQS